MEVSVSEMKLAVIPLMELEPENFSFDSEEALFNWLVDQIEALIDINFEQLLRILYLIDVNEEEVRRLIQDNEGQNAARIMARLILQRQKEKIHSRKKYRPGTDGKYFS